MIEDNNVIVENSALLIEIIKFKHFWGFSSFSFIKNIP